MSVTKEDLGGNKVRLTITVPAQTFQEGIEKAYRKQRGQFAMPGFRKGNVPRAIIEKQHGPEIFYRDALELLLPSSLEQAITEAQLTAVSQPENISLVRWGRDDGVVYTADVYVAPSVELGPYEGLNVTQRKYTIRDVDVDDAVESIRQQNVRWIPEDREAREGDTVVIDFLGKLNGEPFDGGKAENYRLELGSHALIDGFEEQIVGMNAGDDRTITVTFPEDYQAKDLAGKEATFDIHLHGVEVKELPELDDDFAQDVSDFDTLDAFRESLRSDLQESADKHGEGLVEGDLIEQVVNTSTLEVPPPMIEGQIKEELRDMTYELLQRGMTIENYLQTSDLSREQFAVELKQRAEHSVRTSAVLGELIEELGTQATAEEVDAELAEMAEKSKITAEQMNKNVSAEQRQRLSDRISVSKALAKLKDMANIAIVEVNSLDELFAPMKPASEDGQEINENEAAQQGGSPEDTRDEPEEQN